MRRKKRNNRNYKVVIFTGVISFVYYFIFFLGVQYWQVREMITHKSIFFIPNIIAFHCDYRHYDNSVLYLYFFIAFMVCWILLYILSSVLFYVLKQLQLAGNS